MANKTELYGASIEFAGDITSGSIYLSDVMNSFDKQYDPITYVNNVNLYDVIQSSDGTYKSTPSACLYDVIQSIDTVNIEHDSEVDIYGYSMLSDDTGLDYPKIAITDVFAEFFKDLKYKGSPTIVYAEKSVKYGEKNTAKTYADQLHKLVAGNGRLNGMTVTELGVITPPYETLLVDPGRCVASGVVIESSDSTELLYDPLSFARPHYLCVQAVNDSSGKYAVFSVKSNQPDYCAVLAVNTAGEWIPTDLIDLNYLFNTLQLHEDNTDAHINQYIYESLDSTVIPDSTNPYATVADAIPYSPETDAGVFSDAIKNLIEIESIDGQQSTNKLTFKEMFADTMSMNYRQSMYMGKYGTFFEPFNSANQKIGKFGLTHEGASTYSFTTPAVRVLDHKPTRLIVSAKDLKINTTINPKISISTDNVTFPVVDKNLDEIIDTTALTASSDGFYRLRIKMTLPAISGADYYTSKQVMLTARAHGDAKAIKGKIYSICGQEISGGSNIDEYNIFTNTWSSYAIVDSKRIQPSVFRDQILNKLYINPGLLSGSMKSGIYGFAVGNKSVSFEMTGPAIANAAGRDTAPIHHQCMLAGGRTVEGWIQNTHYEIWPLGKTFSLTETYPYPLESISAGNSVKNGLLYYYGGSNPSALNVHFSFNDAASSFVSRLATGASQSHAGNYEETMRNTMLLTGVCAGNDATPTYSSSNKEYAITTDAWSSKTAIPVSIYSTASALAADGNLYFCGGVTGAGPTYSNINYAYTPEATYCLFGLGCKWD